MTNEERKARMLEPGYIPMREDVEWWIDTYGAWGKAPTYTVCPSCGWHVIQPDTVCIACGAMV
jgi:hypothetical protein